MSRWCFFPGRRSSLTLARYLCLVSVIRNPEAKEKKGLIDMNCRTFQEALNDVFSRSWEQDQEGSEHGQTQGQVTEHGEPGSNN